MKVISINMHYRCNAKCVFCVVGIPGSTEVKEMFQSYGEMVEELEKGRSKGYQALVLSGGEPTIHPQLIELISKAKEIGYQSIEMKSNGIKLKDRGFVKELVSAGLDNFCLSIQGPSAGIHDSVVGVPGAFDSIIKGSQYVKEFNMRILTPTCIQKANYQLLTDTVKLFKDIGSDHSTLTFVEPNGSAREYFEKIVPTYDAVVPYLKEAIKFLEDENMNWNIHGFPMCMVKGYEYKSLDLWRKDDALAGSNIEDYNLYEKKKFRVKGEVCKGCNVTAVCNGPWANYVKTYGFQGFEPYKDRSITEIIPLSVLLTGVMGIEL